MQAKRRTIAAGFVALLALALWWPAPVVAVNAVCCGAPLPVDGLSFLGREAPSWDVVFWCIAGLYLIAVLQWFDWRWTDFAGPLRLIRQMTPPRVRALPLAAFAAAFAALLLITWRSLDIPVMAWAERIDSPQVEDTIRIFNRLGGGMNPAMIVLFFLIAGVAAADPRWVRWGVAMALAGLGAGIAAQVVKVFAGRTRPELWLGPFVHSTRGATSFPSGHTIGSFALAGVLLFASRSLPLRVVAIVLACAVGFSRILAFRHWPSDVLASAVLGLFAAWLAVRCVGEEEGTDVSIPGASS